MEYLSYVVSNLLFAILSAKVTVIPFSAACKSPKQLSAEIIWTMLCVAPMQHVQSGLRPKQGILFNIYVYVSS